MKLSFVGDFHDKVMCPVQSNTFETLNHDCAINTFEIFSFFPEDRQLSYILKNFLKILYWLNTEIK